MSHRVEEKLEIPNASSQCGENIIAQHWDTEIALINHHWGASAPTMVTSRGNQPSVLGSGLSGEILVAGLIFDVEENAPDEVRREPAEHHHDKAWEARPEFVRAQSHRGFSDRFTCSQAEAETGTHHTRERCHKQSLLEVELFNRFQFLLGGHFLLFICASERSHPNTDQTDSHTEERDLARICRRDLADGFTHRNVRHEGLKDRGQERSESSAIPKCYTHPKRHAKIAHRKAES